MTSNSDRRRNHHIPFVTGKAVFGALDLAADYNCARAEETSSAPGAWYMSEKPNYSTSPEIDREEEARRRFEADVISRQSNVLPLDAARNEGRFFGQLIRGERQLSVVQRVGFFLVGWILCWWGIFILMDAFPQGIRLIGLRITPLGDKSIALQHVPFAVLVLLLGLKAMITAVAPPTRKSQNVS